MNLEIGENTVRYMKQFIVPVGTLVATIILTVVFGNYFWGNIQSIRSKINQGSRERNVLEEKLDILQTNQLEIQETQSVVTTALPTYSASTLALNQLLRLQNLYETPITELQISASSRSNREIADVTTVNIDFMITGNYTTITAFISDLNTISPVLNLQDIKMRSSGSGLTADIRLRAYNSEPPESIPAISEAIEDLDDSEKAVVSIIRDYTQPSLVEAAPVTDPVGKDNPFVLDEF